MLQVIENRMVNDSVWENQRNSRDGYKQADAGSTGSDYHGKEVPAG